MLALFKKEKKSQGLVVLEVSPGQISFAYTLNPKNPTANKSISCGFQQYNDIKDIPECIADIVSKNKLQNFNCNIILHPDYYHLILIDKPQVPENEYKLAVRWQIKEMVNIAIDDMAVDIFKPAKIIQDHSKKLYLVVTKKSLLKDIINISQVAFLNPMVIDIHEFAIRNLIFYAEKSINAVCFLHILENKSIFLILKDNDIHFSRHLIYGIHKFTTDEISFEIVMEIKHSLDYYHHQLNQPVPEKILLPNILHSGVSIAEKLGLALGIKTQCLNLNDLGILQEQLSDELQINCYVAIGGILRKEEVN